METATPLKFQTPTPKAFSQKGEGEWCTGIGDDYLLKEAQKIFADLGFPKEKVVFISGVGDSSRFTHSMDLYGKHSIHGPAAALASGMKAAYPDRSVWMVFGEGESLSIGDNPFIHLLRKNFEVNFLLFNNQLDGLTKGQDSPASVKGETTKTSPDGSIGEPFNPAELALGAKASFVARTQDRDPKHLQAILKRAQQHKGTSVVEVYQNCPVFNDGAFVSFSEKETPKEEIILLEQGKPLVFGENNNKGIRLNGLTPEIFELTADEFHNDIWVHNEKDKTKANLIARFFNREFNGVRFPQPFGVLYAEEKIMHDEAMENQWERVAGQTGRTSLDKILSGDKTWSIL